ncbi:hypothetical protein Ancab_011611 [Ancistrocladus abbreviatus]
MVMDLKFGGFSGAGNNYQFGNGTVRSGLDESLNYFHFSDYEDPSLNLNLVNPPSPQLDAILNDLYSAPSSGSAEVQSPNDSDSDPVLKYLSQMLMEENMDEKPCMFQDSLALQAAERPFYDALGQKYPYSPNQHPLVDHYLGSPDDTTSGSTTEHSDTTSSASTTNSVNPVRVTDLSENEPSLIQTPSVLYSIQQSTVSQGSFSTLSSSSSAGNGSINSYFGMPLDLNFVSRRESMIQFQKGVEEASKFLTKNNNIVIDLENMTFPDGSKESPSCGG